MPAGLRPDLGQLPSGVPPRVRDILENAWTADKSARMSSASIVAALEDPSVAVPAPPVPSAISIKAPTTPLPDKGTPRASAPVLSEDPRTVDAGGGAAAGSSSSRGSGIPVTIGMESAHSLSEKAAASAATTPAAAPTTPLPASPSTLTLESIINLLAGRKDLLTDSGFENATAALCEWEHQPVYVGLKLCDMLGQELKDSKAGRTSASTETVGAITLLVGRLRPLLKWITEDLGRANAFRRTVCQASIELIRCRSVLATMSSRSSLAAMMSSGGDGKRLASVCASFGGRVASLQQTLVLASALRTTEDSLSGVIRQLGCVDDVKLSDLQFYGGALELAVKDYPVVSRASCSFGGRPHQDVTL